MWPHITTNASVCLKQELNDIQQWSLVCRHTRTLLPLTIICTLHQRKKSYDTEECQTNHDSDSAQPHPSVDGIGVLWRLLIDKLPLSIPFHVHRTVLGRASRFDGFLPRENLFEITVRFLCELNQVRCVSGTVVLIDCVLETHAKRKRGLS